MSVIRHYFNHEMYNFIRVVIYSFASFPSILNVMFRLPLLMIVYVQLIWSVVLC